MTSSKLEHGVKSIELESRSPLNQDIPGLVNLGIPVAPAEGAAPSPLRTLRETRTFGRSSPCIRLFRLQLPVTGVSWGSWFFPVPRKAQFRAAWSKTFGGMQQWFYHDYATAQCSAPWVPSNQLDQSRSPAKDSAVNRLGRKFYRKSPCSDLLPVSWLPCISSTRCKHFVQNLCYPSRSSPQKLGPWLASLA